MKYIVGNWKMNGNAKLLDEFQILAADRVVLCVPYHLLTRNVGALALGAEDCSVHNNGAFTGEISAEMIAETRAKYCIVGHSERRGYFGETNDVVREKAIQCLNHDITPIICVGESREQKESGQTLAVIEDQIWHSIPNEKTAEIIVAYEPVWAIGTGLVATIQDIESVHNHIAELLKKMGKSGTAILYGGSVKPNNAKEILATKNVGGVLVGGAALDVKSFDEIIEARGDGKPKKEIAKPVDELAELKDKYLRAMAELENTRRRGATDIENAARARAMLVSEKFLPLIDAIDKAAEHYPEDEGIVTLKKASDNTLSKLGITRIETVGQILNPEFHNAISAEESDCPMNEIVKEMQSGFMFGDVVLRTALVVASCGKKDK